MKGNLTNKATNAINKVGFQLKKYSPEILLAAGIVGTVASTVIACKATLKLEEVIDGAKDTIDDIHMASEKEELKDKYTEHDAKKDLAIVYTQTAVKVAKLYVPAAIIGGLSITSILASNNILKRRNVALAAAYATVSEGFAEYRKRVVEKFGEEVDKELKYGIKQKKIEEIVNDEETGKEKKVKKTVGVSDLDSISDYAVYFDNSSPYFNANSSDANLFFLHSQQKYSNNLLCAKGFLTFNEVLDNLGIPDDTDRLKRLRKAGMVVGWKYEPDNEDVDNFVKIDIIETYRECADGSVEPCIILDFNVDGNIYNRM